MRVLIVDEKCPKCKGKGKYERTIRFTSEHDESIEYIEACDCYHAVEIEAVHEYFDHEDQRCTEGLKIREVIK